MLPTVVVATDPYHLGMPYRAHRVECSHSDFIIWGYVSKFVEKWNSMISLFSDNTFETHAECSNNKHFPRILKFLQMSVLYHCPTPNLTFSWAMIWNKNTQAKRTPKNQQSFVTDEIKMGKAQCVWTCWGWLMMFRGCCQVMATSRSSRIRHMGSWHRGHSLLSHYLPQYLFPLSSI